MECNIHHFAVISPAFFPQDLNYRINGGNKVVSYLLRSPFREVLHANDQLRLQQEKGAVFEVSAPGSKVASWSARCRER